MCHIGIGLINNLIFKKWTHTHTPSHQTYVWLSIIDLRPLKLSALSKWEHKDWSRTVGLRSDDGDEAKSQCR